MCHVAAHSPNNINNQANQEHTGVDESELTLTEKTHPCNAFSQTHNMHKEGIKMMFYIT